MFFKVKTAEEVQEILKDFEPVGMETIPISEALNRVLGKGIVSEEDMPGFSRSSMDGYAVRAKTLSARRTVFRLFWNLPAK